MRDETLPKLKAIPMRQVMDDDVASRRHFRRAVKGIVQKIANTLLMPSPVTNLPLTTPQLPRTVVNTQEAQ